MRWFSGKGEFAFLSFGSTAKGIIAIGGVAHGVVAIGAFASAGVISIGMNAAGSVVALGLNTVAPVSLSGINGLGILSHAGVNAFGAWSHAGANATGLYSRGGVNQGQSWVPAIIVVLLLLVLSSIFRGGRERRKNDGLLSLRSFLSSPSLAQARVRARLLSVGSDTLELSGAGKRLTASAPAVTLHRAAAIASANGERAPDVVSDLVREEELMPESRPTREASYRERPKETTRTVVRCNRVSPAPPSESWMPKNANEVQWVIAWTARLAAVVTIAILVLAAST